MGKTSNTAKQRWNSEHYTQIKVAVSPEIAKSFKEACRASGVSMASELERHMAQYAGLNSTAPPIISVQHTAIMPQKGSDVTVRTKTLNDRRKAMTLLCGFIGQLLEAEEAYIGNMPVNLQNGENFNMAEERVDKLSELLDMSEGIY